MTESFEEPHHVLVRAVNGSFMILQGELERITANLARFLPPLDGTKLPEYEKAQQAIQAYSKAVITEMNRLYEEDKTKPSSQ